MYDIASGQSIQVAQHDAPIKSLRWIDTPQANFLATGSWDKTLKVRIISGFLFVLLEDLIGLCFLQYI